MGALKAALVSCSSGLVLLAFGLVARPADDSPGIPVGQALENAIKKSSLCEPGAAPFHLKAASAPAFGHNADFHAEIEEYWVSPDEWKRTIHSPGFDQTIIVNGKSRFEKDSSDYFPEWLQQVVTALFDVAPRHAIEEVNKLDDRIALDGEPGRHGVTFHPFSTDGKVISSWTALVTFDRSSGLLTWISGTAYSAGFAKYKSFHGHMVAREIETFPPVPRGDLKTTITELSDLNHPENDLFAIPQPAPPVQQIRTVYVPEVEYRKFAIDQPPMNWPPLKIRPTSGTLATYIVTDRSGEIRDCEFIIADNMNLSESAVQLVKQWRFKPFLVDGVPAQVESTMTFHFDTAIVGDQAKFQAASYYFKRGRDLTFPRTDGSQPFHLMGTFEGAGVFTGYQGSYEETWFAADRWRREVAVPGYPTVVETRLGDAHYKTLIAPEISRLVDRVFSLLCADFPGFAYFSPDTDWTMADVQFDNLPVLLVGMGCKVGDSGMQCSRSYYFDQEGKLRARSIPAETIQYDDSFEFAGKQIPRLIVSRIGDILTLTAHVDQIEPAQPLPDDFFVLPDVRPDQFTGLTPW
jgi:hypothetical protein